MTTEIRSLETPISEARVPQVKGSLFEISYLAYPVVISMLAHALLGITDTWFMGKISTSAQAAVGLGNILLWTLYSFFNGAISSVNTFVSQKEGEGNFAEAGRFVWVGIWLGIVAGLAILLFLPALPTMLYWIGAEPDVQKIAVDYTQVRLYGSVFFFLSFAIISFLRGTGDTKTPMYVSLLMVVLNVPFSWLFIFGGLGIPRLDAVGAAIGTILAQVVALAVLLWIFFLSPKVSRYHTKDWRVSPARILRMMRIGLPMGIHWVLEMGSWTVFTVYVARWGKINLAAHNIVMQALHLSFMPGVAISIAATTLVGKYIGAKDLPSAKRSAHNAIFLSMVYMGVMGILFLAVGRWIATSFNPDPAVVEISVGLFFLAAAFQIFDGLGMAASGALRGAGDAQYPMWITIFSSWCVFVPLVYLLGNVAGYGVYGGWAACTIHMGILGFLLWLRWTRGKWEGVKI